MLRLDARSVAPKSPGTKLAKHAPPTTNVHLAAAKIVAKLQNSVDTSFIVPQYLGLEGPAVLSVGLVFQATGPAVQISQGKTFNGGSFMATKKKAKKKKH
jgi:hypothetical protein